MHPKIQQALALLTEASEEGAEIAVQVYAGSVSVESVIGPPGIRIDFLSGDRDDLHFGWPENLRRDSEGDLWYVQSFAGECPSAGHYLACLRPLCPVVNARFDEVDAGVEWRESGPSGRADREGRPAQPPRKGPPMPDRTAPNQPVCH